jgi:hypothetical protein
MAPPAPEIGFDRFIPLNWVAVLLRVRSGRAQAAELNILLDDAGLGCEAKKKTWTKLNALGLAPRPDITDFVDRGVNIFATADSPNGLVTFSWGVASAAYPFFGKVSELIGRLTSLQGDCSVAEIHRRMSEKYGDRQVIKRATQTVIQTQCAWGVLERSEGGKRLARRNPVVVGDEQHAIWLIEAALRCLGKALSVPRLSSLPVLYPFVLDQPLGYLVSKSSNLETMLEGAGGQFVRLLSTIPKI